MEGRIRLLILRLVLMLSRLSWVVVRVGVSSIMMGFGSVLILRREGVEFGVDVALGLRTGMGDERVCVYSFWGFFFDVLSLCFVYRLSSLTASRLQSMF